MKYLHQLFGSLLFVICLYPIGQGESTGGSAGGLLVVTLETRKFIVSLCLEHFLQGPHGKQESSSGMHSHNQSFQDFLDNPSAFLCLVSGY